MNTVWVVVSVVLVLLIVEFVALRRPDDNWWTITRIFRMLPQWAVFLFGLGIGFITGHFWWN